MSRAATHRGANAANTCAPVAATRLSGLGRHGLERCAGRPTLRMDAAVPGLWWCASLTRNRRLPAHRHRHRTFPSANCEEATSRLWGNWHFPICPLGVNGRPANHAHISSPRPRRNLRIISCFRGPAKPRSSPPPAILSPKQTLSHGTPFKSTHSSPTNIRAPSFDGTQRQCRDSKHNSVQLRHSFEQSPATQHRLPPPLPNINNGCRYLSVSHLPFSTARPQPPAP